MKILLVDDDMLICENVRSKLQRVAEGEKLVCRIAQNVVDAKKLLKEEIPDMVITDLNMPGISGLSLVSYIKREFPQIRVCVLSGYDDYQLVRQAFLNGAEDYLLKPVEAEELRTKIFDKTVQQQEHEDQHSRSFQFEAVLDYIEKNLSRNLTMDEAASNIAMSYNYFSKRFKEYTGYSFPEYVNHRRIQLSKEYLQDPSLKISEIARKVGYQSAATFSRAFQKYEGCYPAEYRRMHLAF